jgi:hypothetical protein
MVSVGRSVDSCSSSEGASSDGAVSSGALFDPPDPLSPLGEVTVAFEQATARASNNTTPHRTAAARRLNRHASFQTALGRILDGVATFSRKFMMMKLMSARGPRQ